MDGGGSDGGGGVCGGGVESVLKVGDVSGHFGCSGGTCKRAGATMGGTQEAAAVHDKLARARQRLKLLMDPSQLAPSSARVQPMPLAPHSCSRALPTNSVPLSAQHSPTVPPHSRTAPPPPVAETAHPSPPAWPTRPAPAPPDLVPSRPAAEAFLHTLPARRRSCFVECLRGVMCIREVAALEDWKASRKQPVGGDSGDAASKPEVVSFTTLVSGHPLSFDEAAYHDNVAAELDVHPADVMLTVVGSGSPFAVSTHVTAATSSVAESVTAKLETIRSSGSAATAFGVPVTVLGAPSTTAATARVVSFDTSIVGDAASFDEAAYRAKTAAALGVRAVSLVLTIGSGSPFIVTTSVKVPSEQQSISVMNSLAKIRSSGTAASAFGVGVTPLGGAARIDALPRLIEPVHPGSGSRCVACMPAPGWMRCLRRASPALSAPRVPRPWAHAFNVLMACLAIAGIVLVPYSIGVVADAEAGGYDSTGTSMLASGVVLLVLGCLGGCYGMTSGKTSHLPPSPASEPRSVLAPTTGPLEPQPPSEPHPPYYESVHQQLPASEVPRLPSSRATLTPEQPGDGHPQQRDVLARHVDPESEELTQAIVQSPCTLHARAYMLARTKQRLALARQRLKLVMDQHEPLHSMEPLHSREPSSMDQHEPLHAVTADGSGHSGSNRDREACDGANALLPPHTRPPPPPPLSSSAHSTTPGRPTCPAPTVPDAASPHPAADALPELRTPPTKRRSSFVEWVLRLLCIREVAVLADMKSSRKQRVDGDSGGGRVIDGGEGGFDREDVVGESGGGGSDRSGTGNGALRGNSTSGPHTTSKEALGQRANWLSLRRVAVACACALTCAFIGVCVPWFEIVIWPSATSPPSSLDANAMLGAWVACLILGSVLWLALCIKRHTPPAPGKAQSGCSAGHDSECDFGGSSQGGSDMGGTRRRSSCPPSTEPSCEQTFIQQTCIQQTCIQQKTSQGQQTICQRQQTISHQQQTIVVTQEPGPGQPWTSEWTTVQGSGDPPHGGWNWCRPRWGAGPRPTTMRQLEDAHQGAGVVQPGQPDDQLEWTAGEPPPNKVLRLILDDHHPEPHEEPHEDSVPWSPFLGQPRPKVLAPCASMLGLPRTVSLPSIAAEGGMTLPSPTNQSICPDGTQPEQPADQPMPQGCTTVQNFEDHSDPPSHPSLPPGELPSGDVLPVLSDDDPSDDVLPLLLDEPHEQLVPTRHTAKPHGSQPLPPDDPQPDGPLPRPRSATGDCGGGRDNERGAEGGAAEGSVGGVDAGGAGGETAPPPSLALALAPSTALPAAALEAAPPPSVAPALAPALAPSTALPAAALEAAPPPSVAPALAPALAPSTALPAAALEATPEDGGGQSGGSDGGGEGVGGDGGGDGGDGEGGGGDCGGDDGEDNRLATGDAPPNEKLLSSPEGGDVKLDDLDHQHQLESPSVPPSESKPQPGPLATDTGARSQSKPRPRPKLKPKKQSTPSRAANEESKSPKATAEPRKKMTQAERLAAMSTPKIRDERITPGCHKYKPPVRGLAYRGTEKMAMYAERRDGGMTYKHRESNEDGEIKLRNRDTKGNSSVILEDANVSGVAKQRLIEKATGSGSDSSQLRAASQSSSAASASSTARVPTLKAARRK